MTTQPTLTTHAACILRMKILDYFIMSDDPQFNTLKRFAHNIRQISDAQDRAALIAWFESEAGQKIMYFINNS